MTRLLPKICAAWFVVSIALPWTAPFPTCDLSDVFGMQSHQRTSPADANADADYSVVSPLVTTAGHLKLTLISALSVTAVPKIFQVGIVLLPADSCGSTRLPCQQTVLRV